MEIVILLTNPAVLITIENRSRFQRYTRVDGVGCVQDLQLPGVLLINGEARACF